MSADLLARFRRLPLDRRRELAETCRAAVRRGRTAAASYFPKDAARRGREAAHHAFAVLDALPEIRRKPAPPAAEQAALFS